MQLLQVDNRNRVHAKTNETGLAMGGMEETAREVAKNDLRKDDFQPRTPHTPPTPQTFELKKNGYLGTLARGLGSGMYDTGLTSQASGAFEIYGIHNRDISGGYGDDGRSFRQSSIDTEPHTLATISVRHAKDGAVEIMKTYDEEEALHMFLKDAEDERLREEALAAILPIQAPEFITL